MSQMWRLGQSQVPRLAPESEESHFLEQEEELWGESGLDSL